MELLTAKKIHFGFHKKHLFTEFNLSLKAGDLLHVKGSNGVGKTTLLKLLAGLLQPHQGEVSARQQSVAQSCLYLGTKLALKPEWSVQDNIAMHRIIAGEKQTPSIIELLKELSLEHLALSPVSELSTGLARRVALTRLISSERLIWLLDEPFSGLDSKFVDWLQTKMQQQAQLGGAVVFTSHQKVHFADYPIEELSL